MTEKTDTRDSDEKVVEFLPDCNKFLHMILIIFQEKRSTILLISNAFSLL